MVIGANGSFEARREGISRAEIVKSISGLRLGDRVLIPKRLMPEFEHADEFIPASVKQICRHHIVFLLDYGIMRSLGYFDCMEVLLDKPSGFTPYGSDRKMEDVGRAIAGK